MAEDVGDAGPDSIPHERIQGDAASNGSDSGADSGSESPLRLLPQLRHDPVTDDKAAADKLAAQSHAQKAKEKKGVDDEDATVAEPFERTHSPEVTARSRTRDVLDDAQDDLPDSGTKGASGQRRRVVHKMNKYSLYETASKFYIVGGDVTERRYRILKIDRNADEQDSELSITDDKLEYTQKQMHQLLDTIEDGNRGTGGMKLRCTTWGLLGFIRFTGPYYMLLITKKSTVAMVGGHYIYQIEGTELIPLTPAKHKTDHRHAEEARYISILHNLDLNRSFYFSYSYDITRTLQYNITKERNALVEGSSAPVDDNLNTMFVWNSHLLEPTIVALKDPFDWCRPIIHGHVDQASVTTYGRTAFITIIARRSRYFAGARFLKRGANDLGYVANDVETEQIVSEALTTSFHAPGGKLYANPGYSSYVQHRGSIPLYWTQDNTGVTPKPPINLNLIDPFYAAAALHFDNLFKRYGAPIYVLNLVKSKERQPRETILLDEYRKATTYLNQSLPDRAKIIHKHMDMSRADKTPGQDVIRILEDIADSVLTTTGFFHNGDGHINTTRVQNGVARTNCIDCLDRTNAAQFVIGKKALGYQLHALGILEDTTVPFDTDAVNLLTHMYHAHGDTIAVQYGGSQLVNTMETYRKINQWTSHSRDMIESFKRYYTNSFVDGQRQEAYNLFLGNYILAQGQPMLWDLATDYYLHHANPRAWLGQQKRSYVRWFTPEFLKERTLPECPETDKAGEGDEVSLYDDYWLEYYRPLTLSSLQKMFAYRMNSTFQYTLTKPVSATGTDDLSPFRVRKEIGAGMGADREGGAEKRRTKKGVTILDPTARDDTSSPNSSQAATVGRSQTPTSLQSGGGGGQHGIMKPTSPHINFATLPVPSRPAVLDKPAIEQQTFTQLIHKSLHPSVATQEADDYIEYVNQSQNLSLVVVPSTTEDATHPHTVTSTTSSSAPSPATTPFPYGDISSEYQDYVSGAATWKKAASVSIATAAAAADEVPVLVGGEEDLALYLNSLHVVPDPLTVKEEDAQKKRYKAYGKWLRGKSLFKQQPID